MQTAYPNVNFILIDGEPPHTADYAPITQIRTLSAYFIRKSRPAIWQLCGIKEGITDWHLRLMTSCCYPDGYGFVQVLTQQCRDGALMKHQYYYCGSFGPSTTCNKDVQLVHRGHSGF
jgi:hypothetical protein